ncbi:DUF3120 domain-containing protein [Oscillatoria sp. FACHB-1406]|nr:DUF3120 domain-containing protein [Oscillatoria sp. FACHB-1406]MBD2578355.1 DUF3120 domain-containing protein [Oscillatoria sp. FACHB-1406]
MNVSELAPIAPVPALCPPKLWHIFAAAAFLVSIPVFFQASLVRQQPLLSLLLSAMWVALGWKLRQRPKFEVWGDLLLGFSWSWLAGSIYWGWWRWEPLYHLPIESIGIPFALWGMRRKGYAVGSLFYLGSLFGTAIGDLYFYLTDLIPYWRQVMEVSPSLAPVILQNALTRVQTPWGIGCAIALGSLLTLVGIAALQKRQASSWAFGGAVLSTIVVEGLFALAAAFAL